MVVLHWFERSEKWGSVLPDDEDSLTFFCMWLGTARANTDHLIECLIAAFCLSRCNAPLHSETIEFDRKRHCTLRWFPTNPTGCVRVCCENDKKEKRTQNKIEIWFLEENPGKLPQTKEPTSQSAFLHFTYPANKRKQACCKSLWMLTNLFSLEMRPQRADSTPSSDQNSRKQYFLTGKKKFWTNLQLMRDLEY